MAQIAPTDGSPQDDRMPAIEHLISDVRAALAAGKTVNEHSIIAAHRELMPELQQAFAALWSQLGNPTWGDAQATQTQVRPGDSTLPGETIARPGRGDTPAVSGVGSTAAGDDTTVGAAGDFAGARPSGRKSQELQIPGYSVQRELSRGGQAVVFIAIQLSTGRKVALKVMHEGRFADERSLARFQREVQILAALDHPNIVSIIDTGQTADGSQFIAMPYITGGTLSDYMHRRQQKDPADPSKLLRMFYKICVAVNEAHLRGIVHRDLKPSNIRVDDRGEPHVLDFGLARTALDRFIKGSNEPVSITGEFMGSLPWASPEQADGDPEKIDMRTDVYSLGVILYQMLTGGRFPYEVVGNIRDVLNNILTTEPKPPSQVWSVMKAQTPRSGRSLPAPPLPVISEAMERIVLKALAKRREQRYQSAGELGKDVARYLLGKPTVAGASGRAENSREAGVAKDVPAAGQPGAGGEAGPKWKLLAAVLGIVVALGVATTLLLTNNSSKTGHVNSSPETREARNDADSGLNPQPSMGAGELPAPLALSSPPAGAWVDLFDGQDLRGWKAAPLNPRGGGLPQPVWNVIGGVIQGGTPPRPSGGILYTDSRFQDFHIELSTMLVQGRNTSISFRRDPAPGPDDLSVHLGAVNDAGDISTTGSVFLGDILKAAAKPIVLTPDQWFTLEITAVKKHIVVAINRQTVVDFTDADTPVKSGCIALRAMTASTLRFKNIRIVDLDAPAAGINQIQLPGLRSVDLLVSVDLSRDTRSGAWTKAQSTLVAGGTDPCRVAFQRAVPQEYDFSVAFERTGPDAAIGVMLTGGGRQFYFGLGHGTGGDAGTIAGFALIDNRPVVNNRTTQRRSEWTKIGQHQKLVLKVRKDQTEAYLDGELIDTLVTDYRDMTRPTYLSDMHANDTLGISASGGSFTIESATLTPVTANSRPEIAAGQLPAKISVPLAGGISMEMVRINSGSFLMGPGDDSEEMPVHKVNITRAFYMGKYPVTQEQWQSVMGNNPSQFKDAKNPAESVSWNDCQAFVAKLNTLAPGHGFALPTEAQWEYACRAGTTTPYFFGDDAASLDDYAWVNGNSGRASHPVGVKKPNPWGLYDVLGNVWQWCADDESYDKGEQSDPSDVAVSDAHVLRGGSWASPNGNSRVSSRLLHLAGVENSSFGLRVMCAAPGSATEQVVEPGPAPHVNLLALVDPVKDAILGSWTNQNNGLTPAILHQRHQPLIEIPYIPPEEYDYRVKFVRTTGDDTLDMVCEAAGRQFSFSIGAWHNKIAAFGPINNVRGDNNATTKGSIAWIQNGQEYLVEVKVRKTGLEAYVDGVLITSHPTDYSDMSVYSWNALRHSNTLGLCVGADTVLTIESAEVIEVTGHGMPLRPAPGDSAPPRQATVPSPAAAGEKWVDLFDGKDFAGWENPGGRGTGPAAPPWRIADGAMVGRGASTAPGDRGGFSVLNASNLYGDFRMRTSTMLADGTGGQIRFFGPNDPPTGPRFLVTVAAATPASDAITGNIVVKSLLTGAAKKVALSPGRWFSLEVAHQGATVTASVNGVQVSSYSDQSLDHLQLRIQFLADANSTARFKDVQLLDLAAPSGGRGR